MSSTTHQPYTPPAPAPHDLPSILAQEQESQFPQWNANIAFTLGCALHARLSTFPQPACIHISTISTPAHVLFHAATHISDPNGVGKATALDNDYWVARKRNAVIRWGVSTWQLHNKYEGDEGRFAARLGLGDKASEYAIHGGGVPIFVKGVDTPVAVCVVSGLKQEDDHQVVVEEVERVCKGLGSGA